MGEAAEEASATEEWSMAARMRLETRHIDAERAKSARRETVILRDDEVVAVLPEGDPLCHTLGLSIEELRSIRVNFAGAIERRPWVKKVLEAIIEYKDDVERERRRQ
jgi:chromosome condensin MukBEF complex kleisin-like MukF subunit